MSYNKDQASGAWKPISVQSWLCDLVFIIWCNRGGYDIQLLMTCSKIKPILKEKKTKDVSEKENKTYIENQTSFKSRESLVNRS